jgi:nitroimidazol reductase NimA-like FMN-containing flavoprotein (pyridoxamine 5'-phosphate oxidase superfamily)
VTVQEIVAANRYMVLATADAAGRPWSTPVWFATEDHRRFYWVSKPGARHSRNIAERPEIGIVIFDSTVTPGDAHALYMAATAEQVPADEIGVFARVSAQQGLSVWTAAEVTEPARHRLYRATAAEHYLLDTSDERVPQTV